jgi:hypothetical protein
LVYVSEHEKAPKLGHVLEGEWAVLLALLCELVNGLDNDLVSHLVHKQHELEHVKVHELEDVWAWAMVLE